MIKLFIANHEYKSIVKWAFSLVAQNTTEEFVYVSNQNEADFVISSEPSSDIRINSHFFDQLNSGKVTNFPADKQFFLLDGKPDYLTTIFYLVNCLQEIDNENRDHFDRFPFHNSLQQKLNIVQENYVDTLLNQFISEMGWTKKNSPSKIYLSHDIDFINGSIRTDLKWAFKRWHWISFFKILWINVLQKPHWFNIDRIVKLESKYDFRSTFFWLVEKGSDKNNIPHADYRIKSESIQQVISDSKKQDFDHGLHKSTYPIPFEEELQKLPAECNRFHFLKFKVPDSWEAIANAGIKADASLGFAEEIGFRNSYGKPFIPFDFKHNRPYPFVEIPLHVMDSTLLYRKEIPYQNVYDEVVPFIEKNKENCILSILFHNNMLTDYTYQEVFKSYKKLLLYLYENDYKTVTTKDIMNEYLKGK